MGSAIAAIGDAFGEIAGRVGQASDAQSEANARLETLKGLDAVDTEITQNTSEDGSLWNTAPERYKGVVADIDAKYPISDPTKRRNFEIWRETTIYGRGKSAAIRYQTGQRNTFLKGLDADVSGLEQRLQKGEIDPAQFGEYYGALEAKIKGMDRTILNQSDVEAKTRELQARLTGALDAYVASASPQDRVKFWENVSKGRYQIDQPTPGPQSGLGNIGAPPGTPPETLNAVASVAQSIGADPRAIGGVIATESRWDTNTQTGSYIGLTQVGPDTLREMGVSVDQYRAMSQAEQAAFYGRWLRHYKFNEKMQAAGIDFKSLPPARQAAVLQAFQFAPNGSWIERYGKGDARTPVTNTKQARALGSTSISDMEAYYGRKLPQGAGGGGARPDKPSEYLKTRLAPGYEKRVSDVTDLHPVMQDRLAAFLAAAEDAGHDIRVVSGQRSAERQAVLWRKAVEKYGSEREARRYVAPPGGSSHQSGEAVDLQYGDRKPGLGGTKTAAVEWAHKNAAKYGLNFPLGHEDWHIEPNEAREGGKRYGGRYDNKVTYWKGGGAAPSTEPASGATDKTTIKLAGLSDEQKAAVLDKAAQNGYRDFTYILDDNERIVAKKSDTFKWGPTGRGPVDRAQERADINNPQQFSGPSWASGVIARLQAGAYDERQVAEAPTGTMSDAAPPPGMSLGPTGAPQQGANDNPGDEQASQGQVANPMAVPVPQGIPMGRLVEGQEFTVKTPKGEFKIPAAWINAIPHKVKQAYASKAKEALRLYERQLKVTADEMMKNQEAHVAAHGRDAPDYDVRAVQAAYAKDPAALAKHARRIRMAKTVHSELSEAPNLPDDEIVSRLERLKPQEGTPHFAEMQDIYEAAEKKTLQILKGRISDPAGSVEGSKGVAGVRERLVGGQPRNALDQTALINARLTAQATLEIGQDARMPLPRQEARALAAPLRGVAPDGYADRLEAVHKNIKQKYGETYSGLVLRQVIGEAFKDKTKAKEVATILTQLDEDGLVSPTTLGPIMERQRLDAMGVRLGPVQDRPTPEEGQEKLLDRLKNTISDYIPDSGTFGRAKSTLNGMLGVPDDAYDKVVQGLGGNPNPPPKQAVDFLRKNPNLAVEFEAKYGLKPGESAKYLAR